MGLILISQDSSYGRDDYRVAQGYAGMVRGRATCRIRAEFAAETGEDVQEFLRVNATFGRVKIVPEGDAGLLTGEIGKLTDEKRALREELERERKEAADLRIRVNTLQKKRNQTELEKECESLTVECERLRGRLADEKAESSRLSLALSMQPPAQGGRVVSAPARQQVALWRPFFYGGESAAPNFAAASEREARQVAEKLTEMLGQAVYIQMITSADMLKKPATKSAEKKSRFNSLELDEEK